jgi:carboxypeptidase Q
MRCPPSRPRLGLSALLTTLFLASGGLAAAPSAAKAPDTPSARADELDRRVLAEARKGSEVMANLTHLSDIIGPRLTGSSALKKANDWAAGRMKKYGLSNVHQEPWTMPEGWQRGPATGRIIEPDNGRTLSLASMGWAPGTRGKVRGEVVIVNPRKPGDLASYKGKLKGAVVLLGPPRKLRPLAEMDKPGGSPAAAFTTPESGARPPREGPGSFRAVRDLLVKEGVAAVLSDAGKPFGLLMTGGGWGGFGGRGADRPSADNRVPRLSVAHEHYALLYRLASRPKPARTRVELEVSNKFLPGPVVVHNTVGEIRGSEKPDEFVVVGAHLDSWDLGQGTLDNGAGTVVVLEAARVLARCGARPKRTIRFVLFTGEEQGLHGSRAYVARHKDEMARTSAALVHDTGTGKVVGLGWMGKANLKPLLGPELGALKGLGVQELHARGMGGSDHVSFARAGVPACMFRQEPAGYRFGHHSQADTLEMAREADLIQGVQVMALTALRLANMDKLLPRDPLVSSPRRR